MYGAYRAPLTTDQLIQYELQPSRDNPDVRETMKEQAQAVGQWEERKQNPPPAKPAPAAKKKGPLKKRPALVR